MVGGGVGEGEREIIDIMLEYCLTYAKCNESRAPRA